MSTRTHAEGLTVETIGASLRRLETKFGMSTADFIAKWRLDQLDHTDPDFVEWDMLALEFDLATKEERQHQ